MKPYEVKSFYDGLRRKRKIRKLKSKNTINLKSGLLVSLYKDYEHNLLNNYKKEKSLFLRKKCECGCDLRLIEGYYWSFLGCPNFRDESTTHSKFNPDFLKYHKVRIDAQWLTFIKKNANLGKEVTWSDLLEFYKSRGA